MLNKMLNKRIVYIVFIIVIIILIGYIMSKKENLSSFDNKNKEYNPITRKEKMPMVPNCNLLNDRDVCSNTKGCMYDDKTLGCYYDWTRV